MGADDEEKKERLRAKEELSSYITQMQGTLEGSEIRSRLGFNDVSKAESALSEAVNWLSLNDEAERSEIANQKRILERSVKPIMSKLWRGGQRNQLGQKQ